MGPPGAGTAKVWHVFGRKKDEETTGRTGSTAATPTGVTSPVTEARPGAKNRPTPSRREAEAARRRPIVPADRDAAKRDSKVREREQRNKHREAMYRGEDWALGPRDKGAQRALVRDIVDSRWNLGEFLLPIVIIALPISLLPYQWAYISGFVILYGMLIATAIDAFLLNRRVKREIHDTLGEDPQPGTGWYVFSRSSQLRGGRIPRPRVSRKGERVTPKSR